MGLLRAIRSDVGLLPDPFHSFPSGAPCETLPCLDFPVDSLSTHRGPSRPSFSEFLPTYAGDIKTCQSSGLFTQLVPKTHL